MKHWADVFDVGPFIYMPSMRGGSTKTYHGKPTDVEMSVAFGYYGDTQIELIQQRNDAPTPYRDFLAAGREGFHHICFWTERYDDAYESLVKAGYQPNYRIQIGNSPRETIYFDVPSPAMGMMVELSMLTASKKAFYAAMREFLAARHGQKQPLEYGGFDDFAAAINAPQMGAAR